MTAVVIYGIGNISKQQIHKIQAMKPLNVLISILFFTFTYLISRVNGRIDMNSNSYGNIVLFYCGAVMGIIAVITLSQWITKNSILTYIGQNTLVILALHGLIGTLIKGFMVFVFHIDLNILNDNTILNVIFTVMTLIIAVPIILFINRYLPELAGKKRLTTAST